MISVIVVSLVLLLVVLCGSGLLVAHVLKFLSDQHKISDELYSRAIAEVRASTQASLSSIDQITERISRSITGAVSAIINPTPAASDGRRESLNYPDPEPERSLPRMPWEDGFAQISHGLTMTPAPVPTFEDPRVAYTESP